MNDLGTHGNHVTFGLDRGANPALHFHVDLPEEDGETVTFVVVGEM